MEDATSHGPARTRRLAHALLAWRDRHPVLSLLLLALATRILLTLAATLGGLHVPRWAGEGAWDRGDPPWRYLARWDSAYYMSIAEHGRGFERPTWAFEPAYPLAIRATMRILPGTDAVEAGVLVSGLALAALVPLSYHLAASWFDPRHAWRATAILLVLPGAVYLGAVYSEGLFLAVLAAFFLALRRRWWPLASALAGLGYVTRPHGIVLPLILLVAVLLERPRQGRIPTAAWLSLPLALVLPAWNLLVMHDATGSLMAADETRKALWPSVTLRDPLHYFLWSMTPIQKAASLTAATLLLWGMHGAYRDAERRRHEAPLELYAFSAFVTLVTFCYSDPAPALRYVLPALAVPWALATWTHTPRRFALTTTLLFTLALTVATLFGGWYPLY